MRWLLAVEVTGLATRGREYPPPACSRRIPSPPPKRPSPGRRRPRRRPVVSVGGRVHGRPRSGRAAAPGRSAARSQQVSPRDLESGGLLVGSKCPSPRFVKSSLCGLVLVDGGCRHCRMMRSNSVGGSPSARVCLRLVLPKSAIQVAILMRAAVRVANRCRRTCSTLSSEMEACAAALSKHEPTREKSERFTASHCALSGLVEMLRPNFDGPRFGDDYEAVRCRVFI